MNLESSKPPRGLRTKNMVEIIVPAYNEEQRIGRVVRGLFKQGYKSVVVVDDGSQDNTAKEAEAAGAKILRHLVNRGQGAALQTGDDYALAQGADLAVHFDGDGQLNPADIKPALEKISAGYDLVLGSRFLDQRSRLPFLKRHILLPVSRWVNWHLTGVKLTDAHNGFRVLNKRALQTIKITQSGMAHNSEIVAQARHCGLRFCEIPVEVTYHEYGQGALQGFKIIRDWVVQGISKRLI